MSCFWQNGHIFVVLTCSPNDHILTAHFSFNLTGGEGTGICVGDSGTPLIDSNGPLVGIGSFVSV